VAVGAKKAGTRRARKVRIRKDEGGKRIFIPRAVDG